MRNLHLAHVHTPPATPTAEIRMPKGAPEVGRWVCLKQGDQEVLWQVASITESPDDDCVLITLVPLPVM